MSQISNDVDYKTEVLNKYLLPALGCCVELDSEKLSDISRFVKLQDVIKYQRLEAPGPREEGALWFPLNGMIHSYFYSDDRNSRSGTRIWAKRDFIFDDASLLVGNSRSNYLEVLEPGQVLSINYMDLIKLMDKYKDIADGIQKLYIQHATYYQKRSSLMQQPPIKRVKQFREENPMFIRSTSQEVQSMHLNLSHRSYMSYLSKLKVGG